MEIQINGKTIQTDAEGYLANLSDWSEDLVAELAARDKLELKDEHWKIIRWMRDYFEAHGTAPNLRILQKQLKEDFGPEWGDKKYLFSLFPFGPAKQAGRYAGTPKPTGCV